MKTEMKTKMVVLCQHHGRHGPWYHESTYMRTPRGTWRFVRQNGAHMNRRRALELGLPFCHPKNPKKD